MWIKLQRASLLLVFLSTLSLAANIASAQNQTTPVKRLSSPAIAKGFIGGESHDSYKIRVRKGRTLSVRISWRREDDNNAEFTVSDSPDFGEPVEFGKESHNGKRWRGKVPRTQNYYIYVVAHPSAHYTLRVTVN